jgi:hypothetical protein
VRPELEDRVAKPGVVHGSEATRAMPEVWQPLAQRPLAVLPRESVDNLPRQAIMLAFVGLRLTNADEASRTVQPQRDHRR